MAAPLILIAEDDRDSREALAAFVGSLGYRTLQAENGAQALQLAERERDLAMVLSDVVMPGLGGIELLEALRARRADVKVVLITGDPPSIDKVIASKAIAVLKPYDFGIIGRVITDALATAKGH